jgi:lytic murein transglycosylase
MPILMRLASCAMAVLGALVLCAILSTEPSKAQALDARQAAEEQFQNWLEQVVWPDAHKQGVSQETFERSFARIKLDWDLPDLQPPGQAGAESSNEQRQAEFQQPGRYFAETQLATLAKRGGELLKQWAPTLDRIEQRYGVPREIIVAIWGRESHFGRVAPQHDALRILATQAFMGRRRSLFYPELLAALMIIEQDHLPGESLLSSWAGAMGQPQLLPSKFLRYAVDGDEDGRRDIWHSVPDSLASIANYLREQGWRPDRKWGMEVQVPRSVSCSLEGPRQGRPLQEWLQLGLVPMAGTPLPEGSSSATAFLLMPAGRLGPAFLVSENFYVLKQYNESDLYALFVSHLADRMRGASAFRGEWRPVDVLRRSEIQAMQERLKAQGYDVGKVDGLVGFATRTAIGRWQASVQRDETCFPDADLIRAIP